MTALIAEDEAVERKLLERSLGSWGYTTVCARDGFEAWEILQRDDAPQLVLLDWMMPGLDGISLCKRIRAMNRSSYTYVMLLTAKVEKEDILSGLEAGADDYLTKPVHIGELQARLRVGRRILDLQNQLAAAYQVKKFEAAHDFLTGIWNRSAILDHFSSSLAKCERGNESLGLLMVDLDHFKQVNDQYGHLAGDAVLREAVRRMHLSLRPYDALGRYGGEEFLIVTPGCDLGGAIRIAERARAAVASEPILMGGNRVSITMSVGVSAWTRNRPMSMEKMIDVADRGLYLAKANGRDRVETIHEPGMEADGAELVLCSRGQE